MLLSSCHPVKLRSNPFRTLHLAHNIHILLLQPLSTLFSQCIMTSPSLLRVVCRSARTSALRRVPHCQSTRTCLSSAMLPTVPSPVSFSLYNEHDGNNGCARRNFGRKAGKMGHHLETADELAKRAEQNAAQDRRKKKKRQKLPPLTSSIRQIIKQ